VVKVRHSVFVFAERARECVDFPSAAGNVSWRPVAVRDYEAVFVGGGLAAMLLLRELGPALSGRVAVLDPYPPSERPTVHWSYWSRVPTLYDRFAVGSWRKGRVAQSPAEPAAPYTLRLVRSTDVFAHIAEDLRTLPIEWLRISAHSIQRREDGIYEVITDAGAVRADWVFDSVPDIEPHFPSPHRPRAVLSGTGVRVTADRPVFDAAAATLFDPLDERSFAYLLPLSPDEALLESATFDSAIQKKDETPLLRYLRSRYPGATFAVTHAEHGHIPLGFAPAQTTGPRHVLLGTKRGLVKPSAGYGVVRIALESERLAGLWKQGRPLPPSQRSSLRWRFLDVGFLQLAAQDPRRPLALVRNVMHAFPLVQSLRFIDEELPPRQLAAVFWSALPAVLGKP
jgi:lycopene beta-cyclase